MVENLGKWSSKRGPISKISPSDGCGRDAVLLAVERRYDFLEFGGYLGNVGWSRQHGGAAVTALEYQTTNGITIRRWGDRLGTQYGVNSTSVTPERRVAPSWTT